MSRLSWSRAVLPDIDRLVTHGAEGDDSNFDLLVAPRAVAKHEGHAQRDRAWLFRRDLT